VSLKALISLEQWLYVLSLPPFCSLQLRYDSYCIHNFNSIKEGQKRFTSPFPVPVLVHIARIALHSKETQCVTFAMTPWIRFSFERYINGFQGGLRTQRILDKRRDFKLREMERSGERLGQQSKTCCAQDSSYLFTQAMSMQQDWFRTSRRCRTIESPISQTCKCVIVHRDR
jgi:hypothetical protein